VNRGSNWVDIRHAATGFQICRLSGAVPRCCLILERLVQPNSMRQVIRMLPDLVRFCNIRLSYDLVFDIALCQLGSAHKQLWTALKFSEKGLETHFLKKVGSNVLRRDTNSAQEAIGVWCQMYSSTHFTSEPGLF